jgi:antitoxin ParD1/3/4
MSAFKVDLPPSLAGFVRRQVEAGLYDDAGDVIRDALRRLADVDERKIAAVKAALAPGVAEADAGIYFDGDIEDILAEVRPPAPKRG